MPGFESYPLFFKSIVGEYTEFSLDECLLDDFVRNRQLASFYIVSFFESECFEICLGPRTGGGSRILDFLLPGHAARPICQL